VLAVGLLIPLAALDNRVADAVLAVTGHDPGLIMTGTAGAIILAYAVRFFGIAQGAVDAAFGRISPTLPMAARSLGRTAGGTLHAVYLPLMRGSVGDGAAGGLCRLRQGTARHAAAAPVQLQYAGHPHTRACQP